MGILFTIWGVWTGAIHLIDWLTFDAVVWWVEPFTIAPIIMLIVMKEKFDEGIKYMRSMLINRTPYVRSYMITQN